ncbi:hypothetical protein [Phaeocystidibacter luteus]|uniref:Uncharacterized protein n=1 Tax=Phaeocystidibacter luteus TaxID=911197 RepID=A0A6N6RKJ5_9FLAO|nr:hypothetical protein [Phaeocystidibacter luteus]KAB2807343.1 hypothetical protein F8C67_12250 [Phaeocystidibacter luteus]
MKVFKFSQESAKKAAEAEMRSRLPLILTSGFAGFILALRQPEMQRMNTAVLAIIAFSLFGVLAFSIWLGLKRRAKALLKHVYKVDETSIESISASAQSVKMDLDKIESAEVGKKGLTLKSNSQKMLIPKHLDGFEELSNMISATQAQAKN